jgi:hypothetical protein
VKDSDHLDDLVLDGRILTWILKIGREGVDRIDLAQNRDKKQTLVQTATELRVPQNIGNFVTSGGLNLCKEDFVPLS